MREKKRKRDDDDRPSRRRRAIRIIEERELTRESREVDEESIWPESDDAFDPDSQEAT